MEYMQCVFNLHQTVCFFNFQQAVCFWRKETTSKGLFAHFFLYVLVNVCQNVLFSLIYIRPEALMSLLKFKNINLENMQHKNIDDKLVLFKLLVTKDIMNKLLFVYLFRSGLST